MPIYSLPPPEKHEIPGMGSVSVRHITYGDAVKIEEATANRPDDDYADHVFAAIVAEPPLTVEAASMLKEPTAAALVEIAADRLALKEELAQISQELPARQRLYEAQRAHYRALAEQMKPLAEEARKQLTQMSKVLDSAASKSIVKSLESLNASLSAEKLSVFKDLGLRSAALKMAAFPQIDQVVSTMASARLPSWVLDDSLIRSGINTAMIHTPAYAPRSPAIWREPSQSELDQRRLSDAFDALVKFEFAIRELIRARLMATTSGPKWWKQRVPKDVIDNCEEKKLAKEKPGRISHQAIYYAYPDDYLKIVTRNDNWQECFQDVFKSKPQVQACFHWIGTARPEVAHARPLQDSDFGNFMFSVSWVIRAIKAS